MTLLPKVKLKASVNFPATVLDGTGIDVTKSNGTYRFDLDFSDFAPPVDTVPDAAHQSALLWNSITEAYTLAPIALFSGTSLRDFDTVALATAATIPVNINYIKTGGYFAAGDGGEATYKRVGSAPTHNGKFQSADGAWWELQDNTPNVHQFGVFPTSSASANSTGFASALAYANFLGGTVVTIDVSGSYSISSAIDNFYSQVLLRGPEIASSTFHDAGTPRYTVLIIPTFAGTVLRHRTPYNGVAQAVNTGGGFAYMTVDGNAIATRLLDVDTVRAGFYELYLSNCVGTESARFTSGVSGTDVGEAADIQDAKILLYIRQLDSVASKLCKGVVFTGSANANFSFNREVTINAQCWTGDAVDVVSADNNDFYIKALMSGAGRGLVCRGSTAAHPVAADSNRFRRISGTGAIYAEGTGDPGVTGGICNSIESLDKGNGTPDPTAGTGSRWAWMAANTDIHSGFRANSVTFPATMVPSADVNALDDYEEGVFTPTLTFATPGNLAVTYTLQSGRYTKVGRLVTGSLVVTASVFTHTTASSFFQIAGLPFVCSTPFAPAGSIVMAGYTKAAATSLILETSNGGAFFFVVGGGSGAARTELVVADVPTGSAKDIFASFQYEA